MCKISRRRRKTNIQRLLIQRSLQYCETQQQFRKNEQNVHKKRKFRHTYTQKNQPQQQQLRCEI